VEHSSFPMKVWLQATGNLPAGKGSRGPVPLVLNFEAQGLAIRPGAGLEWKLSWRSLAPGADRDGIRSRKTNHGSDELPNLKNAEHSHGTS